MLRYCLLHVTYLGRASKHFTLLIKRNLIAFNFSDTSHDVQEINHFILLFAVAYKKKSVPKLIRFIDISMGFNTLYIKCFTFFFVVDGIYAKAQRFI